MRVVSAFAGTCAALAVSLPALALADDAHPPEPPEPRGLPALAPGEPPLPPIDEARPPLPVIPDAKPLAWHNLIELGGGLAVAELPAHVDGTGAPTQMRFNPAPGFHLDLSWQVFRYLRFTGYLSEHDHSMQIPAGSLMQAGTITGPNAHMYSFGVRFSPTLPIGQRTRLWLTAGAGWGRLEYGRYTVTEGAGSYTIFERSESMFEVPLGLGGSFEIIPRWLSLHIELTGAFVPSQIGDALGPSQVFPNGVMANLGAMPKLDAAFLQTIGLSVHL
jgi:hypothetical protein